MNIFSSLSNVWDLVDNQSLFNDFKRPEPYTTPNAGSRQKVGGSRFQHIGESIFSASGEIKVTPFVCINHFFITSILKIYIYISWKTAKVNLCFGQCSQCPMRLVVSTTFKLLGRFKIHRNQMIKICMVYIRLALSYRQFKQSKNINLANVITQSLLILGKKNNFLFRFNGDV